MKKSYAAAAAGALALARTAQPQPRRLHVPAASDGIPSSLWSSSSEGFGWLADLCTYARVLRQTVAGRLQALGVDAAVLPEDRSGSGQDTGSGQLEGNVGMAVVLAPGARVLLRELFPPRSVLCPVAGPWGSGAAPAPLAALDAALAGPRVLLWETRMWAGADGEGPCWPCWAERTRAYRSWLRGAGLAELPRTVVLWGNGYDYAQALPDPAAQSAAQRHRRWWRDTALVAVWTAFDEVAGWADTYAAEVLFECLFGRRPSKSIDKAPAMPPVPVQQ
eukprot:m51a1_g8003 hypothetical protein (277) ;mRNA; f:156586-157539